MAHGLSFLFLPPNFILLNQISLKSSFAAEIFGGFTSYLIAAFPLGF